MPLYFNERAFKCAPTSYRGRVLPFTGQPAKTYTLPSQHTSYLANKRLCGIGTKVPAAKITWALHSDVINTYDVSGAPVLLNGGVNCMAEGHEKLDHLPIQLTLEQNDTPYTFFCANVGALNSNASTCMEFGVSDKNAVEMATAMATAMDCIDGNAYTGNKIAALSVALVDAFDTNFDFTFDLDKNGCIKSLAKDLPHATFDERIEFDNELATLVHIGTTYDTDGIGAAVTVLKRKMSKTNIDYLANKQALLIHALRNATATVMWQQMHDLMCSASDISSTTVYNSLNSVATLLMEANVADERQSMDAHFQMAPELVPDVSETDPSNSQMVLYGQQACDKVQYPADILQAAFNSVATTMTAAEIKACKGNRVTATLVHTSTARFIVFCGHFKYVKSKEPEYWPNLCAELIRTWHSALQTLDTSAVVVMGFDTNLQTIDDAYCAQQLLQKQNIVLFNAVQPMSPHMHMHQQFHVAVMLLLVVFVAWGMYLTVTTTYY